MKQLLRGGTIIDPAQNIEGTYDLLIDNGVISAIDEPGAFVGAQIDETVDVTDLWVTPGLIDIHVHLREPGFEWKETIASGCASAVAGGFTSVCCMPNTNPVVDSGEVVKFIRDEATRVGLARVYPIGAVTRDLKGKQLAPLYELVDAGCVAFSDDGEPVWDVLIMRRALELCKALGVPITCHEEVKELTKGGAMNESPLSLALGLGGMPGAAEDIMVARDIELARLTGAHVHLCHVSTARSCLLIRRAKEDGISVTAEVTPHHLTLTEQEVVEYDTAAKMSPPLRSHEDVAGCCKALEDGTLDCIASDHAPHDLDAKRTEFSRAANGILGFPTTVPIGLSLVKQGVISRLRLISALTVAPAKLFHLPGGTLTTGSVADITVIDPNAQWTFDVTTNFSKSCNSPFWGSELLGQVKMVFIGGARVSANLKVG